MQLKFICFIQISYLFLKTSVSQYSYPYSYANPGNSVQNYYNSPMYNGQYNGNYENPGPQNYDMNVENKVMDNYNEYQWNDRQMIRDGGDGMSGNQCYCSCQVCERPDPCCESFCSECSTDQGQGMPPEMPQGIPQGMPQGMPQGIPQEMPPMPPQSAANLLMVPYPYPLLLSLKTSTAQPTTSTTATTSTPQTTRTTSTAVATTTTAPNNSNEGSFLRELATESHDFPPKLVDKTKYLLATSRRSMPIWVPKYGLVPIPDHLARRLMVKLRETKELQDF